MSNPSVTWRLEGGFSNLTEGTHVLLRWKTGAGTLRLDSPPVGLLRRRRPLLFSFENLRTLRARGPGGVKWELLPGAVVEARVLFPGNAYLGNHRVAKGRVGIQWSVAPSVAGTVSRALAGSLVTVSGSSRIRYAWVESFQDSVPLPEALVSGWAAFRDPFDANEVFMLRPDQVCQFSWTGRVRFKVNLEWNATANWKVAAEPFWFSLGGAARGDLGFQGEVEIEREGSYSIRVSHRQGRRQLLLREEREKGRRAGFSAGLGISTRLLLSSSERLLDPALQPLREPLRDAINRKVGLFLAVESSRLKRRRHLLRAEWKGVSGEEFRTAYDRILQGLLPAPSPRLRFSSILEELRESRSQVRIEILGRYRFGQERRRSVFTATSVDLLGNLLLEERTEVEKTRYFWDEVQFFRLLYLTEDGRDDVEPLIWYHGHEADFSAAELRKALTRPLRLHSIERFGWPGLVRFPARLNLLWITAFSREGLKQVASATQSETWGALIGAMVDLDSKRYRAGSFARDWIDSAEVREIVERDPVGATRVSRYPVPGRSEFERNQVVSEYRRVRSFLGLLDAWASGRADPRKKELAEKGLELPIFLVFHRLCPGTLRRSVVILRGAFDDVRGDLSLWQELRDRKLII